MIEAMKAVMMMIRKAVLALLLCAAPLPALSLDLAGTEVPPVIRVPNFSKTWNLAGHVMVNRSFIPFYALALHVPPDAAGETNLGEGLTPLQLTLVWYASALPKEQVQEYFRKLFEQVSDPATLVNSGPRLEKFLSILPSAERGKRITLLYTPDGGAQVFVDGGASAQFAGIEFNRALLSMWFGAKADPQILAGLTQPAGP